MYSASVYIALMHFPVYNRNGQVVTTAVANMDIHDIARTARTYGVKRFFIVTPIPEQKELVSRILHHWKEGYGAEFNPSRKEAFDMTEVRKDLDEVLASIRKTDPEVQLVATGASLDNALIRHDALGKAIRESRQAQLLLFGTGSGLTKDIVDLADCCLEPIRGPAAYNHLSVRAAVAITLDRLLGR